jgi:hypothetical protein
MPLSIKFFLIFTIISGFFGYISRRCSKLKRYKYLNEYLLISGFGSMGMFISIFWWILS